jgi:biopolymer transport protein ExbB
MSILALTAAAAAAPAGQNPYGLWEALEQGGLIAWSVFIILVGMSIFSFYILFTRLPKSSKRAAPIVRSSTTPWSPRSSTTS